MRKFDKILVTGASGQLGRRLVRELLKYGYSVKAHYRSISKADKYCPENVERVFGDMIKPAWLDDALAGCDCAVHCAARVSVRPLSELDAEYMHKVNVNGTESVIAACRRAGIKRLLHVSTVAAVGASQDNDPLDERTIFNLAGYNIPYFETKHRAEEIALAANDENLEVVVVNPSIMISTPDREVTRKDLDKIPKRIPVYFDFGLNLVETEDVIDGLIKAMKYGRPGQRYLLTGEDIGPGRLFEIGHRYFGIKKPYLKVPNWMLYLIGAIAEILYLFKRKKPKLNRQIARLAKLKFYYSHRKAGDELGYKPKPLEDTVKKILAGINK
jgi:dihydroflavonol-4-reductase